MVMTTEGFCRLENFALPRLYRCRTTDNYQACIGGLQLAGAPVNCFDHVASTSVPRCTVGAS